MQEASGFVDRLRSLLGRATSRPTVDWNINSRGVSFVVVLPVVDGQLPFSVAWSEHEVVIALRHDVRVELGPPCEDGELALGIVCSILSGQVTESAHKGRRSMEIELPNGRTLVERSTIRRSSSVSHGDVRHFLPYW
jgi:hypothetical protein